MTSILFAFQSYLLFRVNSRLDDLPIQGQNQRQKAINGRNKHRQASRGIQHMELTDPVKMLNKIENMQV